MYSLDEAVTRWINGLAGHSAFADTMMVWTSKAGIPLLIVLVAGQWWVGKDRPHQRHVLISSGFSFVLGLLINQFVLLFISRVRPYDVGVTQLLVQPSADFSFPSDHATASFAAAFVFALFGMTRRAVAFLGLAAVIAFSRVYIGIHYAGDVLGGVVTGAVAALTARHTYRKGTRFDRLLTGIF